MGRSLGSVSVLELAQRYPQDFIGLIIESGFSDEEPGIGQPTGASAPQVKMIHWDPEGEEKLAAAILYRYSNLSYDQVLGRVKDMEPALRRSIIDESSAGIGPHDAPVREFEVVDYF